MVSYFFNIEPNRVAIHNFLNTLEGLYAEHKYTFDLSDKLLFQLCLMIDEILTNVVSYGFVHQPAPCMIVKIIIDQKKIGVFIKDNGFSFNPLTFTPPNIEKSIEKIQIGKIGIQFVKTFSRNIQYHREDEFNCLSFECSDVVM